MVKIRKPFAVILLLLHDQTGGIFASILFTLDLTASTLNENFPIECCKIYHNTCKFEDNKSLKFVD